MGELSPKSSSALAVAAAVAVSAAGTSSPGPSPSLISPSSGDRMNAAAHSFPGQMPRPPAQPLPSLGPSAGHVGSMWGSGVAVTGAAPHVRSASPRNSHLGGVGQWSPPMPQAMGSPASSGMQPNPVGGRAQHFWMRSEDERGQHGLGPGVMIPRTRYHVQVPFVIRV